MCAIIKFINYSYNDVTCLHRLMATLIQQIIQMKAQLFERYNQIIIQSEFEKYLKKNLRNPK